MAHKRKTHNIISAEGGFLISHSSNLPANLIANWLRAAFHIDAKSKIVAALAAFAFFPALYYDAVHKNYVLRVINRAVLPGLDFFHYSFGRLAYKALRNIDLVHIQKAGLYNPNAQAACIHRQYFVVETLAILLSLGEKYRLRCAVTVSRHLKFYRLGIDNNGLFALAVAGIAAVAPLVVMLGVAEVIVRLVRFIVAGRLGFRVRMSQSSSLLWLREDNVYDNRFNSK